MRESSQTAGNNGPGPESVNPGTPRTERNATNSHSVAETVQLVSSGHSTPSLLGHQRVTKQSYRKPMKKHKTQENANGHTAHSIRIEFAHPTAASVAIAGTFNDWRPGVTQMVRVGDGRWLKDLSLPPGRFEYRLVVDGAWMPDPRARETAPNPFGELNSVLKIKPAAT
jgi:1,4-alpha-glucan branching enzyme